MPKGRNKGFQYYMCKKFFHPSNPQNLERVFIARQRQEAKDSQELEKSAEYAKEQERWTHRKATNKEESQDKIQLSFMYEPPAGIRKEENKDDNEAVASGSKEEFKFEWQRSAPRESYAKDDPNIIDNPFGIHVQHSRCVRCQVYGHSHTEKTCPRFGQARDHQEPVHALDEKKLIDQMKNQGLKFASYGAWDNGKISKNSKQYDLIFSSTEEESNDPMVELISKTKSKKSKKYKKSRDDSDKHRRRGFSKHQKRKSREISESELSEDETSPRKKKKTAKKVIDKQLDPDLVDKIDTILFSDISFTKKESKSSTKIESNPKLLDKIDDILFSDIVNKDDKRKKNFLSEVDNILEITNESDDSEEGETEDPYSEDSEEEKLSNNSDDLTESEMRLLNLIEINKIDTKNNFPSAYPDTDCHFCREKETSRHLAICPVYSTIMRGSEFEDIKSESNRLVKRGLSNILAALQQRSQALSFTSVGHISKKNMALLDLPPDTSRSSQQSEESRNKLVNEILELS